MNHKKSFSVSEDYWSDLFEELEIKQIPMKYIECAIITFKDGTTWEVEFSSGEDVDEDELDELGQELEELFITYEDDIDSIDIRLDTERVRKDISRKTDNM